jgi:NAD-dependent SIR2 family protein deacetylase
MIMMRHHLLDDSFTLVACSYCLGTSENKEWRSEFEGEIHYKTALCDCGKELKFKVHFNGSGHDSFNESEKKKSIEDKI